MERGNSFSNGCTQYNGSAHNGGPSGPLSFTTNGGASNGPQPSTS